jgi:hypothetical protein
MMMYASGFEQPVTTLTGKIAEISGTDVSGDGTLFVTEVAIGDNFWIVINGNPQLWGVVDTRPSDTLLTLVTSFGNLPNTDTNYYFAVNLVEANKPLLLDAYGDLRVNVVNKLLDVAVSGTVTEVNSAAIAASVASIDGKITVCNTSDISGTVFISNLPAPATDISATILNFPAVQDISGNVNLYALKPTFIYTQLAGEFSFQAYNSFCDGSGTAFLSDFNVDDLVYYVPSIGEPAILLGTVLSISEDVGMYLTGTTISDTLITNYGSGVTTIAPTALVTHTGTDFLSVAVEGTVTEVNSAAILADVSGINGKITACDTGNVTVNAFGTSIKAESIAGGLADVYSDANGYLINRLAGQLGNNGGLFTSNACPIQADLSGCVFTKMFGTDTSGYDVPVSVDNFGVVNTSSLLRASDSYTGVSRNLIADANGILFVNTFPQGTTNVSGQVVLATGTNTIGKVYSYTNPASIITLFDVSAGTGLTVSSSPVTLTAWSPTNLGATTTVCYYKFYNKVGATSSDTPVFTYPVTSSANNTITSIPLYNLTFSVACSVRATLNYAANDTTVPTGRQISNVLYDGFI